MKQLLTYAMIVLVFTLYTNAHSYENQMILEESANINYKIINFDPKLIIYQINEENFCNEEGCITSILFGNYQKTFYARDHIIIPDTVDGRRLILKFCDGVDSQFCKSVAISEDGIDVF